MSIAIVSLVLVLFSVNQGQTLENLIIGFGCLILAKLAK